MTPDPSVLQCDENIKHEIVFCLVPPSPSTNRFTLQASKYVCLVLVKVIHELDIQKNILHKVLCFIL